MHRITRSLDKSSSEFAVWHSSLKSVVHKAVTTALEDAYAEAYTERDIQRESGSVGTSGVVGSSTSHDIDVGGVV